MKDNIIPDTLSRRVSVIKIYLVFTENVCGSMLVAL